MNIVSYLNRKSVSWPLPLRQLASFIYLKGNYTLKKMLAHAEKDEKFLKLYQKEIEYFIQNPVLKMLPYSFCHNYHLKDIKVYMDKKIQMRYVLLDGKRLYYPRKYSVGYIRQYHSSLLMEADKESPHNYFQNDFLPDANATFFDIGAAEGIISLMLVEDIKKLYLFEMDPTWVKALHQTFKPWKNKVKIVNKYVSDITKNNEITLDDFYQEENQNLFIKCDIEGNEKCFLNGGGMCFAIIL